MANTIKNSDFTAEFAESYDVVTDSGDITVTLPNPAGRNGEGMGFVNAGSNSTVFSGQLIQGVSGLKMIAENDFIQLMVIGDKYSIINSSKYYTSQNNSYKLTIDDTGTLTPVQTNI